MRLSSLAILVPLLTCASPVSAQHGRGAPEPVIILVHGRSQEFGLASGVRESWIRALRVGLARAGLFSVPDENIRFVYYGDVFEPGRPRMVDGCGTLPEWRVSRQPSGDLPEDLTVGPVRKALLSTVESSSLVHRVASGSLSDVDAYLRDAAVRCAVEQRLESVLDSAALLSRPVVVVGHSLGALVSFSTLRRRGLEGRGPHVARFVAIGSQISSQYLRRQVSGSTADAEPKLDSRSVGSLVLVKGRFDFAALRRHDAGRNRRLVENSVDFADLEIETDPDDVHGVESYLSHSLTALAIAEAYCAAQGDSAACPSKPAIEACDYDSLALPRLLERYEGNADRAKMVLDAWRDRGSPEYQPTPLSPLVRLITRQTGATPGRLSGNRLTLNEEEFGRCQVRATRVTSSLARNQSDSSRLFMANFGVASDAGASILSVEVGSALTFALPRFVSARLPALNRDIRLRYSWAVGPERRDPGFSLRTTLFGPSYVRLDLEDLNAPGSTFGLSVGGLMRMWDLQVWPLHGHADHATNDLFVELSGGGRRVDGLQRSRAIFGFRALLN